MTDETYDPEEPCRIADPTEQPRYDEKCRWDGSHQDTEEQRPPTLIQALEELRVKATAIQQHIIADVTADELVSVFSDLKQVAQKVDRAFYNERKLAEDRAWQRWEYERLVMTAALPPIAQNTDKRALYWHLRLKLWYFERVPFPLRDDSLLVASIDGDGTMQQPVVLRTDLQ